uniref:Uncharacterized protein n=1 Tax=Arundo donax TaxID=35708 RepID=A0A0A9BUT7_ARUDO
MPLERCSSLPGRVRSSPARHAGAQSARTYGR